MNDNALTVEVDFHQEKKTQSPLTLTFEVRERPSGYLWFKLLNERLNNGDLFSLRYSGIKIAHRKMSDLRYRLNMAIKIINAEEMTREEPGANGLYTIKERAEGDFTQEFSNVIHHHFEVLYGDAFDPSPYMKKSSILCQAAIGELNQCIHDMESLDRLQKSEHAFGGIIFESWSPKQLTMPESFYQDFSLDLDFGDIFYHYGIIGKTWWEVFLDKDEEIFMEAIRPLNVIGADFDILFGDQALDEKTLESFYQFMREKGGDPEDPKSALGHLNVAKLRGNSLGLDTTSLAGQVELKEALAKYCLLGEIRLKNRGTLVNAHNFLGSYTTKYGFFSIIERSDQEIGEDLSIEESPILLVVIKNMSSAPLKIHRITGGWKEPHNVNLLISEDSKHGIELHPGTGDYEFDIEEKSAFSPGQLVSLNYNNTELSYLFAKKNARRKL